MADDLVEPEPIHIGCLKLPLIPVSDACEEIMLLWCLRNPPALKQGSYVCQGDQELILESCGHMLRIQQAPSSLMKSGVTGSVMWDSGVVLGKFLEHAVDGGHIVLKEKRLVELGAGCGLLGIIGALLGGQVFLTDTWDRLRLLQKNVDLIRPFLNRPGGGSALVHKLVWGDEPPTDWLNPSPDFVIASDVIFDEEVVHLLLSSIVTLSGPNTITFLAAELRNDTVLEAFLHLSLKTFHVGRIACEDMHPEYVSQRVVIYAMALRHTEDKAGY